MILYPTETVYGLGVHALDAGELQKLYELKGRDAQKAVSWLVRDVTDMEQYAEVSAVAAKIAARFLPGPLTLVLPIRSEIKAQYPFLPDTIGFRVSTDPEAQKLIAEYMNTHHAPLTCTSANVSGFKTGITVSEILKQFGDKAQIIDTIIDGGERSGTASTVVQILDSNITILREGALSEHVLREFIN